MAINTGKINHSDAYMEGRVLGANPVELVNILYEAALESIAKARRHLRQGDIRARSREITRAQMIVAELEHSLSPGPAQELSRNLAELYAYVLGLLGDANIKQIEPPLIEAAQLLTTLLEAWRDCPPRPAQPHPEMAGVA